MARAGHANQRRLASLGTMSGLEQRVLQRSGIWREERSSEESKLASPSAKFTLPSDIAMRKGIRNPLDIKTTQLPKLYNEPSNTLNQFSRVDDAAHVRPSDRIGRNYTASSKMLSIAAIEQAVRPSASASPTANPFSRADLQSINVPQVLDPLHIPVHPGKGSGVLIPSPKRTDRKRYSADSWKPELHGSISNDATSSEELSHVSEEAAHRNLLNFRDAVDAEDDSQVVAIKKEWVLRCLKKVRKYSNGLHAEEILTSIVKEMHDEYTQSVKTAIVNYKILSPRGAGRALVDGAVLKSLHNWRTEQSRWNEHLTDAWRVLRITGIDEKSILASKEKIWAIFNTLGSAMGRLQQLWLSRVGGIRLCDNRFTNFRTDYEFQRSLPVRMPAFSQRLLQEISRVRSTLKTSWLVAAGFILTQHLKYYKEALHFNLFGTHNTSAAGRTSSELAREEKEMAAAEEVSLRSANVLMSRQLREIVEASVQDLVEFFRHKQERSQPALTVSVKVQSDVGRAEGPSAFALSPGIPEVGAALEKCIDDLTDADKNFPSIELLVRPKSDPQQPFLQACRVQPTDHVVKSAKRSIRDVIEAVRAPTEGSLDVFAPYADLFNGIEEAKCSKLIDDAMAMAPGNTKRLLNKMAKEVERYQALARQARSTLVPFVAFPIFVVDCSDAIDQIVARAESLADRLIETVVKQNRSQMKAICDEFDKMQQVLLSNPDDSAKLQELQDYWAKCDEIMSKLQKTIHTEVFSCTKFIFHHGRVTGVENGAHMYNEDTRLLIKVLEWPEKIKDFFEASKRMQDARRDELLAVLKLRKDTFSEELKDMERQLTKLINQQDYATESVHMSLEMVTSLRNLLTEAVFEAERINAQENELQIDEGATDYEEQLSAMQSKVEPLDQLWTLVSEYSNAMDQWMNHPLNTVDAEAADSTADNLRRGILKLKKTFDRMKIKQPTTVAASIAGELKTFLQEMIPLMTLVCTPGLKDRHWEEINKITGLDVERTPALSLYDIADFHLEHYVEQIEETCITAVKEFSLEKALMNMEAEWETVDFTCKAYRETGTYILAEIDEVQQLLDDQIVKIQAMRSSRYIKPFAARASAWEKLLRNVEEIIENWLKVQGTWLYLEPIFSSDDIQKQMPAENERFKVVDGTWRESMAATAANPKVTTVAKTEGLVERLKEANVLLDLIQKGLNDYLETKRLFFPRFFFLSNDELLEILAETKDPRRVQPHLKKCFEGINRLNFDDDLNILGMISKEGEEVEFQYEHYDHAVVNPNDARGLVERWLLDVETVMRKAVAYATDCSMEVYEKSVRTTWLKENPGMVVLATAMKVWTHDVEKALPEGQLQGVFDKMQSNLLDVVDMVRAKIPKIVRKAVGALCVIDVHNQSVVRDMMEQNVQNKEEFPWLSQMRYYWIPGGPSATTGDPGSLECKMITSTILYAYEYLGLSMRLVITPLTDRCYRTMMGAIALNFGGAPEGPAGTGKTETVKDLAKTLAMLCVVFNCSDGLDFRAMAKFFKGLASAGAWACFDEFNRIELEVLSVVAQQILTIQRAKVALLDEFFFEGTHLGLRRTANVYITMNPGYAGRSDLPDNLKALFRTVAMMVPDYGMIAEIMLYSMGYEKGKSLSVKIVATYKLCSEQLSSQKHYDYGMRAVMAVLRAAANLKLADSSRALETGEPTTDEDVLMLRAILDVNLAKFLSHDIPLFNGIVSDLFPGVVIPDMDRGDMDKAARKGCADLGLQPTPAFMKKVMQIYEMLVVRHGFMIVGLPFAGKTSGWKVLRKMLQYLHEWHPEDKRWCNVYPVVINPKAVTMGQLYGQFDDVTHEWTDGIIPIYYRNCAVNKVTAPGLPAPVDSDRKWVLFDGPVDAIWIENMNTVLDDNKKLCLMSGEIIAMTDPMSMMFEPMDLEVASPATVSRCGMIYMEPHELGWRPLLKSWFEVYVVEDDEEYEAQWEKLGQEQEAGAAVEPNAPKFLLNSDQKEHIEFLCEWLVDPLLAYLRKRLKEVSPTLDQFLVQGLLRNIESLLDNYIWYKSDVTQTERLAKPQALSDLKPLEGIFMYSLVWSLGSSCNETGRQQFDEFLRRVLSENISFIAADFPAVGRNLQAREYKVPEKAENGYKPLVNFPADGSVYSFVLNPAATSFVQWTDTLQKTEIAPDARFSDIIVGTPDTASFYYNLQMLIFHSHPVLVCGVTGTGKSAYTMKLVSGLDRSKFQSIDVGMSAKTTCNQVQDIIDSKVDKRRKGVYGPPPGMKSVIFIDDFNMPEVEEYGAQPPVELVRQLLANGGWYDLVEKSRPFRTVVDTCVVAAMGPAGGGRNNITPRMLRHFSLISTPEFSDDTMVRIFTTIVDWYFKTSGRKFASSIANTARSIVPATLAVFKVARAKLLPTPAKSHYVFNLRDMARVIQGITMVQPYAEFDGKCLARLWLHECGRVFGDRLIDDRDQDMFTDELSNVLKKTFGLNAADLCKSLIPEGESFGSNSLRSLFFGDFLDPESSNPIYSEISDMAALSTSVNGYLEEYNSMTRNKMDLVMFQFAIEHLARIIRVIKMPGGNYLLVGVGGSGRQSLTRLAASVADYDIFQIEISKTYGQIEWREDIKKVLRGAGHGSKQMVFLFSDAQIKNEGFVEDINNILNSGEVPNIFPPDEKAEITDAVRKYAKEDYGKAADDMSPQDLYAYFVKRVKTYLHVVLAFSPIGDGFRQRLRKFPSLINCCTIDWFREWPSDALVAVAEKFLSTIKFDSKEVEAACVTLCSEFHNDTRALSARFLKQLRRNNYVTPTSYLELIKAYQLSLGKCREVILAKKKRYEVGLEKLEFAASNVKDMQKQLTDLQPVLAKSQEETNELMKEIEKKLPGVKAQQEQVGLEAAAAQKEADVCAAMKAECEADLAEAIPILNAAIASLNTLKPKDIGEVKSLAKPPAGVRLVMEAVCVMCGVAPDMIKDPEGGTKKIKDYWAPSKKLLATNGFLQSLIDYDKDNIDPKIIATIRDKYCTNPDFTPEKAQKSSAACAGLCRWTLAMEAYDRVAKVVAPKKAKLKQSEAELAVVMGELDLKKAALAKVEAEFQGLQDAFEAANKKKADLEAEVKLCGEKLVRAQQLIESLGGEKDRWSQYAHDLGELYIKQTGDVLISAGIMAYLGPFTSQYRDEIIAKWVSRCQEFAVPCSDNVSLTATLGDSVLIRDWNIQGLPTDSFSVDNGIIVFNARRWPLMIDPQGQANKWVRKMESDNGLNIIKLSDSSFLRTLENAIQFGQPVLLENIGETLDPSLEPLLLKLVFKQGGVNQIRLGDANIEYSDSFRFYMTTKLRNPHYLPEVAVKVTLLNFMITPSGLEDQLLGVVVREERPDLEQQKNELIVESAKNNRILKEVEDKILYILGSSSGNILEDSAAIEALKESKVIANDIAAKQVIAAETEATIDSVRKGYKPVAFRAQLLFFCISDLANIEPVYQYSLDWFVNLFILAIKNSTKSKNLGQRLGALNDYFTFSLYVNICRSLLEKDKLLFSFLLCKKIMEGSGEMDSATFYFLLTGGVAVPGGDPNPTDWLSDKSWGELCRLSDLPAFVGLSKHFAENTEKWKVLYDRSDAHNEPLPAPWHDQLKPFQRLCVLRCIRPDKVVLAIQDFVVFKLGREFVEPPPFDLKSCYDDSSVIAPLVFILSPGSDPMASLLKFANDRKVKFASISLGQGQGERAEQMITTGRQNGTWVVLQNCHLAVSWMPDLERIVEGISRDNTNAKFRLWLTTYPSDKFPVTILQNGVKMTNEPPKGLKANLLGSYTQDPISDPDFFDSVPEKPMAVRFRKLVYSLCFFHAIIQERLKFGALGWNIPYEYNDSDRRISVQQLSIFLNNTQEGAPLPFAALQYCFGECNYGGRVTDDKDRRCLLVILRRFYNLSVLDDKAPLSSSGEYVMPEDGSHQQYIKQIQDLPLTTDPEVFGMHDNANITKDQNETNKMFASILLTQANTGGSGGDGKSQDEIIDEVTNSVLDRLPENFDIEQAQLKFPINWAQSMNTVLVQELQRFNGLLDRIRSTCRNLIKAIAGQVVMSDELEKMGQSMFFGRVPEIWKQKSYPSLKPLAGYYTDFLERIAFLQKWFSTDMPAVYWLSGFFFTQAFLTGVMQNFARKYTVPIDQVIYEFEVMREATYAEAPKDGAYINGLFFDCARWDMDSYVLADPLPKVLFSAAPIIWLKPKQDDGKKPDDVYNCPVYKTSDRRGVLATTGHSSNFVMWMDIPTDKEQEVWIERGVALLTTLDD